MQQHSPRLNKMHLASLKTYYAGILALLWSCS
uniref:Uncharacterized protein n=1 Tax=Anguilla anguilla TaxID=7936 RepID=A0A0E9QUZ4_ANGAN